MLLAGTILLRLVARDTICNCWYRLFLVDWWGGVVVGFIIIMAITALHRDTNTAPSGMMLLSQKLRPDYRLRIMLLIRGKKTLNGVLVGGR